MSNRYNDYPIYKYADDMRKICQPLFDATPINFFAAVRVHNYKKYLGLTTDENLAAQCIDKGVVKANIFSYMARKNVGNDFLLWNSSTRLKNRSKVTKELFVLLEDRGYECGITFIERYDNYHQNYYFACPNSKEAGDEYLLDNIVLMKKFILYFKEKMVKHKRLSVAFDEKSRCEASDDQFSSVIANYDSSQQLIRDFDISRYHLNTKNSDLTFTRREIQCLQLLARGFSMTSIASELQLSPRTIETHLETIKHKTKSKSKKELLQFFIRCKDYHSLICSEAI